MFNKNHRFLHFISVAVVIVLISFISINLKKDSKVEAVSTDNLSGFAWSENIGWISFNSSNCSNGVPTGCPAGTPPSYGVTIDPNTGLLSGYAFSENIGWITFNSSQLGGCPSGTCNAKVATTTSTAYLTGWARACAGTSLGDCSATTTRSDGWDGWIKLYSTSPAYGVTIDTALTPNKLKGWAWGSDVVGWVSFSSTNCNNGVPTGCPSGTPPTYGVTYNGPSLLSPGTPVVSASTSSTCGGYVNVSWSQVAGATSYVIYRNIGGVSTLVNNNYIPTANPVVYSDLAPAMYTAYTYTVYGKNSAGALSQAGTSASVVSSVPCAPTGFSASTGSYCGGQVSLQWNTVSGAASYVLRRSTTSSFSSYTDITVPIPTSGSTVTYLDVDLNPNASYFYRVFARSSTLGLSAYTSSGQVSSSNVCVNDDTDITIQATPALVEKGDTCTVSWTLGNLTPATRCSLIGAGVGSSYVTFNPNNSGAPTSFDSTNLQKESIYTMTCSQGVGGGSPSSMSATCRIKPVYKEF
jgi:hypothetical protein